MTLDQERIQLISEKEAMYTAIDAGTQTELSDKDEQIVDEINEDLDAISKMLNSKKTKKEYYTELEHDKERHIIPPAIRVEVLEIMKSQKLSKEIVDKWNPHLDFDLHTKLSTYGTHGSRRLYSIFSFRLA